MFKPFVRTIAVIGVVSLGLSTAISLAATQRTLVDLAREGKRDEVLAAIASSQGDVNAKSPDGATALMWAINNSDLDLARALLKAGARADVVSNYGASALGEAIKQNDLELVRALLDAGADVNSTGTDNQTALMTAINVGPQATKIAELLIQRGADINAIETFRGQNALMWAAAGNMPEIVEQLVARGATNINMRAKADDWDRMVTSEPRGQFGSRYSGGMTALLYATRSGCLRCVQALVKAGADIEKPNPDGVTPLLNAVDNSRFDVAMFLLDQGADPHRWDMSGRTPIYSAVDRKAAGGGAGGPGAGGRGGGPGAAGGAPGGRAGGPGAAGGPPGGGRGGPPGGPGALAGAGGAARGAGPTVAAMDVIKRLISMGVDVNHELTRKRPYGTGRGRFQDYDIRGGVGPLFLATFSHDHEVMEALLKAGAEVDAPNAFRMTPLMIAAGMRGTGRGGAAGDPTRALKSIDLLLDAGANINMQVTDSRTHTGTLMAYVAGRDQEGRTALFAAAEANSDRIVKHLLDRGADATIKDATGKTALDYAKAPPAAAAAPAAAAGAAAPAGQAAAPATAAAPAAQGAGAAGAPAAAGAAGGARAGGPGVAAGGGGRAAVIALLEAAMQKAGSTPGAAPAAATPTK